jgi:hypothetical protein
MLIVANEIRIAVSASKFEVPIVGRQPRVDNFRDGDPTVSKNQCAWGLLAAMTCVALDANREDPLFMHPNPIYDRSRLQCPSRTDGTTWGVTRPA